MEELKKAKKCLECNGEGGGNEDYLNEDHNLESGTGDWVKCEHCNGTGEEPNEGIIKDRLLDSDNVIEKLGEYLVNKKREINGRGVTKDNFEDMFENWLSNLSLEEITKMIKDTDIISDNDF